MEKTPNTAHVDFSECDVVTLFEEVVKSKPEATAMRYRGRAFTYSQVNAAANRIASRLLARSTSPETLVAILLDTTPAAVVSVLGILKAGAAYVALDPAAPKARLEEIVADAGAATVLTSEAFVDLYSSIGAEPLIVGEAIEPLLNEEGAYHRVAITADSLAYVTYTSGSTGKPKGVALTHRSITNGLNAVPFDPGLKDEVCSLNSALAFGFSVSRLFLPLLTGVPLVVLPSVQWRDAHEIASVFQAERVTSAALVTPMFHEIVKSGRSLVERLESIRTLTIGGTRPNPELVLQFGRLLPRTKLLNGYAASEIGGAAIVWEIGGATGGRPFPNTSIHILDSEMRPVPEGTPGEIYVGAPHLSRGYWRQASQTAERFVPNPFGKHGTRLFRTGDIGRRLPNDDIEILDRLDNQTKVRGYRVHLIEIEAAVEAHDDVKEAAITATNVDNDSRLAAYIVPRSTSVLNIEQLRSHLRRALPEYMIPSDFFVIDKLPRTLTGKLDRDSLVNVRAPRLAPVTPNTLPRNQEEEQMCKIWEEVLGVQTIDINEGFVNLGGDSLNAIQLLGRISAAFKIEITLGEFLQHQTIAGLCEFMLSQSPTATPVEPVQRISRSGPLPLSFQQEHSLRAELFRSDAIAMSLTRMGLSLEGDLDTAILRASLNEIIKRHEILRTAYVPAYRAGPVLIEGWAPIKDLLHNQQRINLPEITFRQQIFEPSACALSVDTATPDSTFDPVFQKTTQDCLDLPFDLSQTPLLRLRLVRATRDLHYLLIVMPHIVSDAWSMQILIHELHSLYVALRDNGKPILPVPTQYIDFAVWQQRGRARYLAAEVRPNESEPVARSFGFGPANTSSLHDHLGKESLVLSPSLVTEIRRASQEVQVTTSMTVFAAFSTVLSQITKQKQFSIVILQANRTHPDLDSLLGFVASSNIVSLDLAHNPTIGKVFDQVRKEFSEATWRQGLLPDSENNARKGANMPHGGRGAAFERRNDLGMASASDLVMRPFMILWDERPLFPLQLVIDEGLEDIAVSCFYCTDCFPCESILPMLTRIRDILSAMVTATDLPVSTLDELFGDRA